MFRVTKGCTLELKSSIKTKYSKSIDANCCQKHNKSNEKNYYNKRGISFIYKKADEIKKNLTAIYIYIYIYV